MDRRVLKEDANCIFRVKMKGKDVVRLYRNATLKVLTEIHSRNLKTLAASLSETTIKIFSVIKNSVVDLVILPVTQTKVSNDWTIGYKCGRNSLRIV